MVNGSDDDLVRHQLAISADSDDAAVCPMGTAAPRLGTGGSLSRRGPSRVRLCSHAYQESDWARQEQDKREFECTGSVMYVVYVGVCLSDHDSRISNSSDGL